MDKIKMSDELKEKIKKETAKKLREKKKKSPLIYVRYASAIAACLVICFAAVKFSLQREATPDPPVLVGNPIEEFSGIDTLTEKTPFDLKTPGYLPEGYGFSGAALIFGETAEVKYTDGVDELCYRCAESESDVSEDYNTYDEVNSLKTGSGSVTVKGKEGKAYLATWQSGKMSYSLSSKNGLSEEETVKIIESIK